MNKPGWFASGFATATLIVTAVAVHQHLEIRRAAEAPQTDTPEPNAQPDAPDPQRSQPQSPSQPAQAESDSSIELLRLRGEVGQLRQEIESVRAEKDEAIKRLITRGVTLLDRYWAAGFDTNTVPNIPTYALRNQVLAELNRVGANIVTQAPEYIYAEVSLATVTNGGILTF
jgi:hypothetical protein